MRAFRLSHVGIVAALGMAFAMELSAATPSVFQADSGATCAVPAKTLSFDCGSACELYEPCMLTSPVTASCDLECFTIDSASPSAYKYFNFLIPYDSTVGDTKTTAHKNNSALTKVATTKLPVSTTDVYVPKPRVSLDIGRVPANSFSLVLYFETASYEAGAGWERASRAAWRTSSSLRTFYRTRRS